jgi:hypothetical protein
MLGPEVPDPCSDARKLRDPFLDPLLGPLEDGGQARPIGSSGLLA